MHFAHSKSLLTTDELVTDERGWSFNLAIFRVVFLFAGALPWAIRNFEWAQKILPGLPRNVWAPISFYQWIPYSVLGNTPLVKGLAILNIALIVLGIFGFYTRACIASATLLSLYLFGLMENLGKVDHFHHLIWFMALLAAGPSGRFLSIDSIRNAVRRADRGMTDSSQTSHYALWTFRYTWLLMGLLYLVPGVAKLHKAFTAGWASAPNLHHILWRKWFESALFEPGAKLPVRLDLLPSSLLEFAAYGVIAFEIGFLFLVLFRRVRPLLALGGIGFHIGNGIILGIWFTTLFPVYVALIDWAALGRVLCGAKHTLKVFYDGNCSVCRRTAAIVRSWDLSDVLELHPVRNATDCPPQFPQLTHDVLLRDLCVAQENRTASGYDAYVQIATRLFLLWPLSLIMRLPLVARYGRKIYRRIADRRHCAILPRSDRPQDAKPEHSVRPLHVVGIALLSLQLAISGIVFLNDELPAFTARLPWLANRTIVHISRLRPLWPFAPYPTFAYNTEGEFLVWEARWVVPAGEVRATPFAYSKTFGNSALVWNVVTSYPYETDEQRMRSRSEELLGALWQNEQASIRSSAKEARVYYVRYQLESAKPPATLVDEKLIATFSLDSLPLGAN
jgi:predicted DCC family thiol-disulfide oxidoreductase YuxK